MYYTYIGCVKFTAKAAADPPKHMDSTKDALRGAAVTDMIDCLLLSVVMSVKKW